MSMKQYFLRLLRLWRQPKQNLNRKIEHSHYFILQYRTGNAFDGKTEVLKCDCGQWAIRPYGAGEYTLLDK